jgi:polyisoprenoid-binding protein YceI
MSGRPATPPARRTIVETLAPVVPAGTWTIDAAASSLRIGVKFGFLTINGRFTQMTGQVRTSADVVDSEIAVTVRTASLTSGNKHWDAMLTAAGLIDAKANPTIEFESTGLTGEGDRWTLDGLLVTERGCLPVTFALICEGHDSSRLRFRATGSIRSADAARLLSVPGVEKVVGKMMTVDLAVEAVRA